MAHEGTVRALTQAHRVLVPGGSLIDLRPDRDPTGRRIKPIDVFVVGDRRLWPAGHLLETAEYYADYLAAERGVNEVLRRVLFRLEGSDLFYLRSYLRSFDTLLALLQDRWTGTRMPAPTRDRLHALLRRHPAGRIRVDDLFRLTVLRKA